MYILSIDQSTTATKAFLFGDDGKIAARHDIKHRQITNERGWVEHDPVEIFTNTIAAVAGVIDESGICRSEIVAAGLTNQRETAVCWDKETGEPVYNAIVWQCGRATEITDKMDAHASGIRERTGLNLSPYFSAAKYSWIIKNVKRADDLLEQDRLCCGTIDSWLLFRLTDHKQFKTDYTNASRTQLLNLDTLQWDRESVELFGLKESALPELCHSDSLFGYSDFNKVLESPIPVCAMIGDSHAALLANGCVKPYNAKATLGTGTSVMMNVGKRRVKTENAGVVETIAFCRNGEVFYAIEGNINYSGAVIKWLADDLELVDNAEQTEEIAAQTDDTNGVYIVPAFSGLGAPYWDNNARAIICGMNRTTKKAHIVRAALEAIGYQIKDIIEILNACCKNKINQLSLDGGAMKNAFLTHFIADILNIKIYIPQVGELSAAGAAMLALNGSVSEKTQDHQMIEPKMSESDRERLYSGWKKAVSLILEKE